MSKSNTYENAILALYFNATTIPGVAENASVSPITAIDVALHTVDPGEAGTQATNEVGDAGYARVSVARSGAGWVVTGNSVSPAADITFAQIATLSANITHWSVGDGGTIRYSGTVTPNILAGNNITPILTTATAVTED